MNTRQIEKQNWDKQKVEDHNLYNVLKNEKMKVRKKENNLGYLSMLIERKIEKLSDGRKVVTQYLKRTKYTKLK